MLRLAPHLPLGALVAPLSARLPRIVVEVAVVSALLLMLLQPLDAARHPGLSLAVQTGLEGWLALWPAWRLARSRNPVRWRRIVYGFARTLLAAGVIASEGALLMAVLWPAMRLTLGLSTSLAASSISASVTLFLSARLVVSVGASLVRHARRRLRWQLTLSHLAVIMLTFVGSTAIGSAVGISGLLAIVQPHTRESAVTMARLIGESDAVTPGSTARLARLTALIAQGNLLPVTPLFTLVAGRATLPVRLEVLDLQGRVLAAAVTTPSPQLDRVTAQITLPAAALAAIRSAARGARAIAVAYTTVVAVGRNRSAPLQIQVGAAPIHNASGRVVAIAVVGTEDIAALVGSGQLLTIVLGVFGLSTLLLLTATFLPTFGLASLFGYVLARGLTRRLEAVSRVTTAIAAGDYSQRVPIHTSNEVAQLAASVNRMATHLEGAVGALQTARTQAEGALRARQELVASISHELRTPLAILRAHLEMLNDDGTVIVRPGETGELTMPTATLRALRHETERLAGLVDDLFTLARAETGALDVQRAPLDVGAIVEEIARLMRPLAMREGQIALSVEVPRGLPPALGDGDRLRQILSNLVRNAVRYTPEGGIIVLSVAVQPPWLVVAVVDTGEGIAPEHLPHLFERFYRVDQARTRSSGGTGLGLAIVREFVEAMGGRVTVESTLGEGSCFRVYLPLVESQSGATAPIPALAGAPAAPR